MAHGLHTVAAAALASMALGAAQAAEGLHVAPLTDYANTTVAEWMSEALVVEAVKAQNVKNAGLSEADIDSLDKQWRAEVGGNPRPMIDEMMGRELSTWLASMREDSGGFVTEVFVMDNRGLNVGQSDVTSDYWQGDEAKWQETFLKGTGAVFVDEVERDESTQMLQSQVSVPIVDPATSEVIGAVTVGVNVDQL
jgi:hypothetical protein